MSVMSTQIAKAKQLYQSEKFNEAKSLITKIISESQGLDNSSLFAKLGEIETHLCQYKEAAHYFQQSLELNPENASICVKLGNLFRDHLSDDIASETNYQKCIQIDTKHEQCWFEYGKLKHKQNRPSEAEYCFLKCRTERACVNYHYALLLLQQKKTETESDQALQLLAKACELQPKVIKYQYKYAMCLKEFGSLSDAQKVFVKLLKLSSSKDIKILYECAQFESECMKNKELALKYIRIAMNLDKGKSKFAAILRAKYDALTNLYDSDIKLLIYNLERTITYNDLNEVTKGKGITVLEEMGKLQISEAIFGRKDRVKRLHMHFERVLSSENNVRLVLISTAQTEIVFKALGIIGLMKYFDNCDVIGSDKSKHTNILQPLTAIANEYKLDMSENILFIDGDSDNLKLCKKQSKCKYYACVSDYTLNGLSCKHLYEIECILGVETEQIINYELYHKQSTIDLQKIDYKILRSIRNEVKIYPSKPIAALPVMQYINTQWTNKTHKKYANLYANYHSKLIEHTMKKETWLRANLIPYMMKLAPTDYTLHSRYAVCLKILKHNKECEYYYKLACQRLGTGPSYFEYGFFLYQTERYALAEKYLEKASKREHELWFKYMFYQIYANTLSHLSQPKKAEYYFKLALKSPIIKKNKRYHLLLIHCHYGTFLCKQKRYSESVQMFKSALEISPYFAETHHGLSRTYYEMKEFEKFETHLHKALECDPYLKDAIHDWNKLIKNRKESVSSEKKEEKVSKEKVTKEKESDKSKSDRACDSISESDTESECKTESGSDSENCDLKTESVFSMEFDRFWFEIIGITNGKFNKYYDRIVSEELNDIRIVLFDKEISKKFNKIVIKKKDFKVVMKHVESERSKNKRFAQLFKSKKVKQYLSIFTENAIYTLDAFKHYITSLHDIKELVKSYKELASTKKKAATFKIKEETIDGLYQSMKDKCI